MESNFHAARTKKDMKIRPVMIHNLYKNNTHPHNNTTIKSNSQVNKKPAKQNGTSLAKPLSGAEFINRQEPVQSFETLYTSMQNKSRLQIQQSKNKEEGRMVFKPMKSTVGRDLDLLFPLIVKRVSFQVANQNKQKEQQQKDSPGLPRTALFVPFLKNTLIFLPSPNYKELTHPDMDVNTLQELSRNEVYKGPRKVVYEIYEVSPYTKNNSDYDTFLAYNSEATVIDSSWDSYPAACIGKGGPIRYFTGKARYQEELIPYYLPESLEDKTLVFESRFESGNLRRAVQM